MLLILLVVDTPDFTSIMSWWGFLGRDHTKGPNIFDYQVVLLEP